MADGGYENSRSDADRPDYQNSRREKRVSFYRDDSPPPRPPQPRVNLYVDNSSERESRSSFPSITVPDTPELYRERSEYDLSAHSSYPYITNKTQLKRKSFEEAGVPMPTEQSPKKVAVQKQTIPTPGGAAHTTHTKKQKHNDVTLSALNAPESDIDIEGDSSSSKKLEFDSDVDSSML
ncbi:BAP18 [Mytilus edulis]|uniref:BAP18 n=1 Tax=Mytilus edulis TaxID=6550 RepID=A0A8S3QXP3_MYTED|nr:BAP18 [Mytilus edulis]